MFKSLLERLGLVDVGLVRKEQQPSLDAPCWHADCDSFCRSAGCLAHCEQILVGLCHSTRRSHGVAINCCDERDALRWVSPHPFPNMNGILF